MTLYLIEYDDMEKYEDNYTYVPIVCSSLDKARQYIASGGRCRQLEPEVWRCDLAVERWRRKGDGFWPEPVFAICEIEVDEPIEYFRRWNSAHD